MEDEAYTRINCVCVVKETVGMDMDFGGFASFCYFLLVFCLSFLSFFSHSSLERERERRDNAARVMERLY